MRNSTQGFSKDSPESLFWWWFEASRERFALEDADPEEVIGELGARLEEYQEGLVCELTVEHDGTREFVVSAAGIRENFPAVVKLVESAPAMPGWRITAFRPRMEDYMACTCDYEGREFDPKEIWFYAVAEDGELDFIFYHPNYSEEDRELIAMGTYILLDMAIGEEDVVCGIRNLDHQPLPEDPAADGLMPFSEFRAFFDENVKRE